MLQKLEVLDLSDNEISGTIPDIFEDMNTIGKDIALKQINLNIH